MKQKTVMDYIRMKAGISHRDLKTKGNISFGKGSLKYLDIQPCKAALISDEQFFSIPFFDRREVLGYPVVVASDSDTKEVFLGFIMAATRGAPNWLLLYFNEFNYQGESNCLKVFDSLGADDLMPEIRSRINSENEISSTEMEMQHKKEQICSRSVEQAFGNNVVKFPG